MASKRSALEEGDMVPISDIDDLTTDQEVRFNDTVINIMIAGESFSISRRDIIAALKCSSLNFVARAPIAKNRKERKSRHFKSTPRILEIAQLGQVKALPKSVNKFEITVGE